MRRIFSVCQEALGSGVITLGAALMLSFSAQAGSSQSDARGDRVISAMTERLCTTDGTWARGPLGKRLRASCRERPIFGDKHQGGTAAASLRLASSLGGDGAVLRRMRLAFFAGTAMDLIAYSSDGLAVGGLLCYPDDGGSHPGVIHVHGGFSGIFDGSNHDSVQLCADLASRHGVTAFMPSLRGRDGGEGTPELCLGEARDVAAAATMLRDLEVTDPMRLALMGGSIGGCVALKASGSIPDLSAVVAFVPPTDWKRFVVFHRDGYQPATEVLCDGSERAWNVGGTAMADVMDLAICGYSGCPDAAYDARSPLPALLQQNVPTMIVSAGADNIVPVDQQLLWSILRQQAGVPTQVIIRNPCDPPEELSAPMDVHLYIVGGFHLLSPGSISSGFLFAFRHLGL